MEEGGDAMPRGQEESGGTGSAGFLSFIWYISSYFFYPVLFLYGWSFLAPQHINGQFSSFLRFYILKALECNEIFCLLNRYISLATLSVVTGLVVGLWTDSLHWSLRTIYISCWSRLFMHLPRLRFLAKSESLWLDCLSSLWWHVGQQVEGPDSQALKQSAGALPVNHRRWAARENRSGGISFGHLQDLPLCPCPASGSPSPQKGKGLTWEEVVEAGAIGCVCLLGDTISKHAWRWSSDDFRVLGLIVISVFWWLFVFSFPRFQVLLPIWHFKLQVILGTHPVSLKNM